MPRRPMPRTNARRAQRGAFVPLEIPPLSQLIQRLGRGRRGVADDSVGTRPAPAGRSVHGVPGPTCGRLDRTTGGIIPEEGQ